jgi:hypothetical protein
MKIIIAILFFLSISGLLSACVPANTEGTTYYFDRDGNMTTTKPETKSAEKLEVYYFHRTARCFSCNTMSELADKLMADRYAQQVADGSIDFRKLNVDLPENKEIALKYKATGSSLYINRIIDGQDNIVQDVNVWRYLGDKNSFNNYLSAKIDSYLGI